MQTVRSEYYNLPAAYVPELRIAPSGGILEQRFQSVSASQSVVRFRINSSAPRALMLNRLRITVPITFTFDKVVGKQNPIRALGKLLTGENHQVYLRGVFERCLQSVSLEINNSASIVRRTSDLNDLFESLLVSDYEQQFFPMGPQNKPNKNGYFTGRAADFVPGQAADDCQGNNAAEVNAMRWPVYSEEGDEIDSGAAKKLKLFRQLLADKGVNTVTTGLDNTNNYTSVFDFTFDLDIGPFSGRYSYGKGFGYAGRKDQWLPFHER